MPKKSMREDREEVTDSKWENKDTKPEEDRRKRMAGLTFMSVHGVFICLLLLVSFCFAWFTEVISGPSFTIMSASYGIEAGVSGNGAVTGGDNNFEVENGKLYDITLEATGSASIGFCIISAGDVVYHTAPIEKDEKLSFHITFPGNGTRTVEFVPYWGVYREEISAGNKISVGATVSGNN